MLARSALVAAPAPSALPLWPPPLPLKPPWPIARWLQALLISGHRAKIRWQSRQGDGARFSLIIGAPVSCHSYRCPRRAFIAGEYDLMATYIHARGHSPFFRRFGCLFRLFLGDRRIFAQDGAVIQADFFSLLIRGDRRIRQYRRTERGAKLPR